MKILLERFPYRYVEMGILDNGFPDYRIQKADHYTKRYSDMYLVTMVCNLLLLWRTLNIQMLDPDRVPCYVKDNVSK